MKFFAFLLAALIASGASAASLNKSNLGGVPYSSTGKTATMGSGGLTAPGAPGRSMPSGSEQIGQSGYYYGANGALINPSSGQTMTMGLNGDVYFAGTKYPFQAGYPVSGKSVADAALGLIGGWPGVALTATISAYPYIKAWLDDAGASPNPNATGDHDRWMMKEKDGCYSNCYTYGDSYGYGWVENSPEAICQKYADQRGFTGAWALTNGGSLCRLGSTGTLTIDKLNPRRPDNELPKSMDDIAPYLNRTPFNPGIVNDIIQGGGTINLPEPNITGPTQVKGDPVTTTTTGSQNVGGQDVPTKTTTTSTTTYNFTTNNNQVTNTTNNTVTTTVTVNQSTGAVISTQTQEKEEKPEEKEQPIDRPLPERPKLYDKKYPEGLSGVWNKQSQQFKSSGLFGLAGQLMPTSLNGGSCPSFNLDMSIGPWADYGTREVPMPCWIWDTCKYILLLTAAVSARRIVFGG